MKNLHFLYKVSIGIIGLFFQRVVPNLYHVVRFHHNDRFQGTLEIAAKFI